MTSKLLSTISLVIGALVACTKPAEPAPDAPPAAVPAAGNAANAPANANPGVTDSELVLGEPTALTGASAGLGIEQWRGSHAAFEEANAKGGVNGRKIKLVLADDSYNADKAAATVIRLLHEPGGVFAIYAGVGTPTIVKALPVILEYHKKEGLFRFANFTGAQPQRNPPYVDAVFNIRASYYEEVGAMVDAFVAAGKKKIATFVQDDAYGTDGRTGVEKALAKHGLKIVADTRYPRGQSYDVHVDEQLKLARDAGADAVIMVGSYQACAAYVRDARTAGWNVPIHNVSFVGADQMLKLLTDTEKSSGKKLAFNLINTQVVPDPDDTSVQLVNDYRAAMKKYAPPSTVPSGFGDLGGYHPSTELSFGSLEGYLDARAFLAILEKTGKDVTRGAFYKTAESMGQFDLGLGVPLEFSPTRHQALDKVWFTYATPEGWKPTSDPMSTVK